MIFVSAFDNIDRVQIYTEKVDNVYSEWSNKVRGQKTINFGSWVHKTKMCPQDDFTTIAENLIHYLNLQNISSISSDQFCALLYYQSLGILVDYQNGNAVFVNKYTNTDFYDVYVTDDNSNLQLVASIPKTTGHFHYDGYLYYAYEDTVWRLNLKTAETESYFVAKSNIKYLNYKTDCTANGGKTPALCINVVTAENVCVYSEYHSICGDTPYSIESDFNENVGGYYVFSNPHNAILMYDNTGGSNTTYHIKED